MSVCSWRLVRTWDVFTREYCLCNAVIIFTRGRRRREVAALPNRAKKRGLWTRVPRIGGKTLFFSSSFPPLLKSQHQQGQGGSDGQSLQPLLHLSTRSVWADSVWLCTERFQILCKFKRARVYFVCVSSVAKLRFSWFYCSSRSCERELLTDDQSITQNC